MTDYRNILYATIVIVCGFLLIFLIGFTNIYRSFLKDLALIDYVSFNSEKVDTINKVVGDNKRICTYDSYIEEGHERYEIRYCDQISSDDFNLYTSYLMNEGFVETFDDNNVKWYVKESVDNNKIIGVHVDESKSTLVYQKSDGYLYEKEEEADEADHL